MRLDHLLSREHSLEAISPGQKALEAAAGKGRFHKDARRRAHFTRQRVSSLSLYLTKFIV